MNTVKATTRRRTHETPLFLAFVIMTLVAP